LNLDIIGTRTWVEFVSGKSTRARGDRSGKSFRKKIQ
jgi:hypothetical protein